MHLKYRFHFINFALQYIYSHDFRPDYCDLKQLRQNFSGVPFMALTATATPRVREDVVKVSGDEVLGNYSTVNTQYFQENKIINSYPPATWYV